MAVGTGDDFSTPLGAGLVGPGTLEVAVGTGEVVGAVDPRPIVDGAALVETNVYPAGGYFLKNPGWLSGGGVALLYPRIQRAVGHAGVFALGYAAMALGFLQLVLAATTLPIFGAAAAIGAGYALVSPPFIALALNLAPARKRGLAGGGRQHLAEDHLVDLVTAQLRALEQRLDDGRAEFRRRGLGEGAAELADRGAGGGDDDDVGAHALSPAMKSIKPSV